MGLGTTNTTIIDRWMELTQLASYRSFLTPIMVIIIINCFLLITMSHGVFCDSFSRLETTCPEDSYTFECSVTGQRGSATVWQGSVLSNCSGANPPEITLLHNRPNMTIKLSCAIGTIVGTLYAEDNQYTSLLTVTITSNTSQKVTIECSHDNGTIELIGSYTINDSEDSVCDDSVIMPTHIVIGVTASVRVGIIVTVIMIAVTVTGIIFGIMMKRLLLHKNSKYISTNNTSSIKQELANVGSSSPNISTTSKDKSLYPLESEYSIIIENTDYHGYPNSTSSNTSKSADAMIIVSDEILDLDSLLLKLRGEVDSTLWYQFGMAIGVPMDILEKLNGYPEVECMIELADYWLRNHPTKPTWSEIRDAVQNIKPANHLVTYDFPGPLMDTCSCDSITLSYSKLSRPQLQKCGLPPSFPPRMDQEYSIATPNPPE